MDDVGRIWLGTVLPIALVLISWLLNIYKSAVLEVNESCLKLLEDEEDERVEKIYEIRRKRVSFSTRTTFSSMVLISAAVLLSVNAYAPLIENLFSEIPLEQFWAEELGWIAAFFFCVTISGIFGYTLPRRIGAADPKKYLPSSVGGYTFIYSVVKALSFIPSKLVRGILLLCRIDPDKNLSDVTEEEIRRMLDAGNESGSIELSEREMINNVFDFDDLSVSEVMTHRTDIDAVERKDSIKVVIDIATKEGFSRVPVYEDDIDSIVGIINVKDMLRFVGKEKYNEVKISDIIRPVIYVPETARCSAVLKKFQAEKCHFAVVVDEYGGTAGIVTMEDLLESIVGNIQDEYDSEDEEISKIDENTYSIYGGVMVDDVEELFDCELDKEDESETLSGLMLNTLGFIPTDGETPSVVINGIEFTAELVEERRIVRITACRLPLNEELKENKND